MDGGAQIFVSRWKHNRKTIDKRQQPHHPECAGPPSCLMSDSCVFYLLPCLKGIHPSKACRHLSKYQHCLTCHWTVAVGGGVFNLELNRGGEAITASSLDWQKNELFLRTKAGLKIIVLALVMRKIGQTEQAAIGVFFTADSVSVQPVLTAIEYHFVWIALEWSCMRTVILLPWIIECLGRCCHGRTGLSVGCSRFESVSSGSLWI